MTLMIDDIGLETVFVCLLTVEMSDLSLFVRVCVYVCAGLSVDQSAVLYVA